MFLLNLHFAPFFFAFGFVEFFGPVYLLSLGYALYQVTAYWMFFFTLRLILRPFLVALCHHLGFKKTFKLAIVLFAGRYLFYAALFINSQILIALLLYESFASILYWLLYHAAFAATSSSKTGRDVAWRDSILNGVRLISPISGAAIIHYAGFTFAYLLAFVIALTSVLPILKIDLKGITLPTFKWKSLFQTEMSGFWLYGTSAFHEYGHNFLWKIALYLYLSTYVGYGGLLSLAMLFQIFGAFVIANYFDTKQHVWPALIGICLLIVVILCRSFVDLSVARIVGLDVLAMIGTVLFFTLVSTINYSRSKGSRNPLWYQTLSESGWDIGAIFTLSISTLLLGLGHDIRPIMSVAIIGIIGSGIALWKFSPHHNQKKII